MADPRNQPGQPPRSPDQGDPDGPTTVTPKFARPGPDDPDGPTVVTPKFTRPAPPATAPPPRNSAVVDPDAPTGLAPHQWPAPQPAQLAHPSAAPQSAQQGWPAPAPAANPGSSAAPQGPSWSSVGDAQQHWLDPATSAGPYPGRAGGFGAPPRRRRPALIAGIFGAAVVLVVVVVGAVSLSSGGPGGASGSPAETVTAYLEALRDGDAEKALSYGKGEPASKDFLTDEVLGKQIAEMPISDIRILDKGESQASFGFALVKVAANFGATLSETTLHVTKVDDEWKLDNTFARIDTDLISGGDGAAETLTLFDKPIEDQSVVYVFPGMLDVGSTNDYLEVDAESLVDLRALGLGTASLLPKYALNDEGTDAVAAAVADAFVACERSRALSPPGCPYRITRSDAVDGTVTWGRADISGVSMSFFSAGDLTAMVSGPVTIPVSFQTVDGRTAQGDFEDYLTGTVDLTLKPPKLVPS